MLAGVGSWRHRVHPVSCPTSRSSAEFESGIRSGTGAVRPLAWRRPRCGVQRGVDFGATTRGLGERGAGVASETRWQEDQVQVETEPALGVVPTSSGRLWVKPSPG